MYNSNELSLHIDKHKKKENHFNLLLKFWTIYIYIYPNLCIVQPTYFSFIPKYQLLPVYFTSSIIFTVVTSPRLLTKTQQ